MTPPYEERGEYTWVTEFTMEDWEKIKNRLKTKFMCSCGRPIGDVEYHNGRSRLRYYNGKFTMFIYWGVVCCQVCGMEREFHGVRTCADEPTTYITKLEE